MLPIFKNQMPTQNYAHPISSYMISARKPKIYDNEVFYNQYIEKHVKAYVYSYSFTSIEIVNGSQSRSGRFFDLKQAARWHDDKKRILSTVYDMLSGQVDQIETFYTFEGKLGKVCIPLYFRINGKAYAVFTTEINIEDLLNLLSIKDIAVIKLYYKSAFVLEGLPSFQNLLAEELQYREELTNRLDQWNQRLVSRSTGETPSFEDRESCHSLYRSLSEAQLRTMNNFLYRFQKDKAASFLYSEFEVLSELAVHIPSIDLMIQTKEMLDTSIYGHYVTDDPSRIVTGWGSRIRYLDYRLSVDYLSKRYQTATKWVDQFLKVCEPIKDMGKSHSGPDVASYHYQAALMAAEALKELWFISEVRLFGSVANGTKKSDSFIDLVYRTGFDVENLTLSRRNSLERMVTNKLEKLLPVIKNKYPEIQIPWAIFRPKLFNVMCLDMEKKRARAMYEQTGFFDGSIVLFNRDQFAYAVQGNRTTMAYKSIEYVVVPTHSNDTAILMPLYEKKVKNGGGVEIWWKMVLFTAEYQKRSLDGTAEFVDSTKEFLVQSKTHDFRNRVVIPLEDSKLWSQLLPYVLRYDSIDESDLFTILTILGLDLGDWYNWGKQSSMQELLDMWFYVRGKSIPTLIPVLSL